MDHTFPSNTIVDSDCSSNHNRKRRKIKREWERQKKTSSSFFIVFGVWCFVTSSYVKKCTFRMQFMSCMPNSNLRIFFYLTISILFLMKKKITEYKNCLPDEICPEWNFNCFKLGTTPACKWNEVELFQSAIWKIWIFSLSNHHHHQHRQFMMVGTKDDSMSKTIRVIYAFRNRKMCKMNWSDGIVTLVTCMHMLKSHLTIALWFVARTMEMEKTKTYRNTITHYPLPTNSYGSFFLLIFLFLALADCKLQLCIR